jgi:hypothetical protein
MSGQSAHLSISEAKAMMKRTEASHSKDQNHTGPKNSSADLHTLKKTNDKHQGK